MKITRTTTMEQLKNALGANAVAVKEADKNLFDQMVYTSNAMKSGKKVTKKDLADLVKECIKVLGDKFVEPVLAEEAPAPAETPAKESSLKTKKKGGITKAEKSEEEKAPADTPAPKVETSEKSTEKKEEAVKSAKKTGKKEAPATKKSVVSEKAIQLADTFADTLEIEGETYTIAHDIKDIKTLHDALDKDEQVVFATYWTKRHLRQFNYSNFVKAPKSFPNDLDLASCLYISDDGVIAYALSMYTEGMYSFLPEDLAEEADGLRYSNGMEFQIYRKK